MLLNLVNAGLKLVVGVWSANLTVLSDAAHGFLDACNNMIGLIVVQFSFRPPDQRHPYGHRKLEALAALAVGGLMILMSWEILKTIVGRFGGEVAYPPVTALWLAMIGIGLAINVFITVYETRRGRQLQSMILLADAAYTRSDVFVTMLSLISLLAARRHPWLDGSTAAIVVVLILYNGWKVVRDNALLLSDTAQLDPNQIRRVTESVEGASQAHAIRTRGMPDEVHLDLHIVVDPGLSAEETFRVEDQVRRELMEAFPNVMEVSIHHQTHTPRAGGPLRRESRQDHQP